MAAERSYAGVALTPNVGGLLYGIGQAIFGGEDKPPPETYGWSSGKAKRVAAEQVAGALGGGQFAFRTGEGVVIEPGTVAATAVELAKLPGEWWRGGAFEPRTAESSRRVAVRATQGVDVTRLTTRTAAEPGGQTWEIPVVPGALLPWNVIGPGRFFGGLAGASPSYGAYPTAYGGSTAPTPGAGQLALPASPVMRATQPGVPAGTGSGVQPAPAPRPPAVLDFMLVLLDLLRSLGIHLPWDPRAPRAPSFSFTFPTLPPAPPPSSYPLQPPTFGGFNMANVWQSILTAGGQLLGGVLQGVGQAGQYGYGTAPYPVLPGGAPTGIALPQLGPMLGLAPPQDLASPFTMRGAPRLHVMTGPTGRLAWFRPAGRPVLFSGDLAACKRVRKVAGMARRRVGGR